MIEIREMQMQDVPAVCAFVKTVFDEYLSSTYTDEGNRTFYAYIEPQAMRTRMHEGGFGFVAESSKAIVSHIEIRNNSHICLLFTHTLYQRQGLAHALVDLALTRCSELDPHIAAVSVNAAVSAVSTYQRLGFKTIDSVQQRNGITFVPMIRLL